MRQPLPHAYAPKSYPRTPVTHLLPQLVLLVLPGHSRDAGNPGHACAARVCIADTELRASSVPRHVPQRWILFHFHFEAKKIEVQSRFHG